MLVDRIGGHLGDVLGRLGLDVEGDERVRHQVVDRLEPLLPDEVLPIVEQPVVEGLLTEPEETKRRGHAKVRSVVSMHQVLSLHAGGVSTSGPRCVSLAAVGFP